MAAAAASTSAAVIWARLCMSGSEGALVCANTGEAATLSALLRDFRVGFTQKVSHPLTTAEVSLKAGGE